VGDNIRMDLKRNMLGKRGLYSSGL